MRSGKRGPFDRVKTREEDLEETIKKQRWDNEDLEKMIQKLRSPPQRYVTFVRVISHDGFSPEDPSMKAPVLEVKDHDGDYARVLFCPKDKKLKAEDLSLGQVLVVVGGGGIGTAIDALPQYGLSSGEAQIEEHIGTDEVGERFLVSFEEEVGKSVLVHAICSVNVQNLKPGDRVLVDATSRLIVQVLPKNQASEYVVAEDIKITFDDIGGLRAPKENLIQDFAYPILYRKEYEKIGLSTSKGCVLYGPPGCGKTSLAKAIFQHMLSLLEKEHGVSCKDHFRHIAGPSLQSPYVGVTERKIRNIFAEAKEISSPEKPVLLFIDESESFLSIRDAGISSDTAKQNVGQWNASVDGLEGRGDIIIILATNRLDMMDKAVIRPGRIDRVIEVPRPTSEEAEEIFRVHLKPTWDEIHTKYNTSVYVPVDSLGEARVHHATNQLQKYPFHGKPERARDYLIEKAVKRMYDPGNERNKFLRVKFFGDANWSSFNYADFLSGAMIENIVKRAKQKAIIRYIENKNEVPCGIELEDLHQSIEEIFDELKKSSARDHFSRWFFLENVSDKREIENFEFVSANDTLEKEIEL